MWTFIQLWIKATVIYHDKLLNFKLMNFWESSSFQKVDNNVLATGKFVIINFIILVFLEIYPPFDSCPIIFGN